MSTRLSGLDPSAYLIQASATSSQWNASSTARGAGRQGIWIHTQHPPGRAQWDPATRDSPPDRIRGRHPELILSRRSLLSFRGATRRPCPDFFPALAHEYCPCEGAAPSREE